MSLLFPDRKERTPNRMTYKRLIYKTYKLHNEGCNYDLARVNDMVTFFKENDVVYVTKEEFKAFIKKNKTPVVKKEKKEKKKYKYVKSKSGDYVLRDSPKYKLFKRLGLLVNDVPEDESSSKENEHI